MNKGNYGSAGGKRLTKKDILTGTQGAEKSRFIGNNTVEYFIGEDRFIRFHNTDILIFSGDSIRISSGGWRTVTTKDRISKYLPSGYRLFSENGFWYISHNSTRFPFKDGMVIDLTTGKSDSGDYEKNLSVFKKDQKKVTVFINKYADLLISGKMKKLSSGDCFICQIAAQNPDYKDYSHLQSHIDEIYLVPALIWAACRATNSEYYLRYIQGLQLGESFGRSIDARTVKHILRKYFKQQKG